MCFLLLLLRCFWLWKSQRNRRSPLSWSFTSPTWELTQKSENTTWVQQHTSEKLPLSASSSKVRALQHTRVYWHKCVCTGFFGCACAVKHVDDVTALVSSGLDSSGEPLCLISSSVESGAELLKVEYCKVRSPSDYLFMHGRWRRELRVGSTVWDSAVFNQPVCFIRPTVPDQTSPPSTKTPSSWSMWVIVHHLQISTASSLHISWSCWRKCKLGFSPVCTDLVLPGGFVWFRNHFHTASATFYSNLQHRHKKCSTSRHPVLIDLSLFFLWMPLYAV